MRILAFDPGRRTGWALSTGRCGTIDVRQDMAIDEAGALWTIHGAAMDLLKLHQPSLVVIERPMGRMAATEWPQAVTRVLHMAAWAHDTRRAEIGCAKWRKVVIGRATKVTDHEVAAAVRSGGFNPANEHEGDAAALIVAWRKINRSAA